MKGLGVKYHCAKAEFVTLFGPRAMGPSPLEHWGCFCAIYLIEGGAGGPPESPLKMTKLTNNDKCKVWDGLLDLKCTPKNM